MSKAPKPVFVCQECGAQAQKWLGKCPDCGAWNSYVEERAVESAASSPAVAARRLALVRRRSSDNSNSDALLMKPVRIFTAEVGELVGKKS